MPDCSALRVRHHRHVPFNAQSLRYRPTVRNRDPESVSCLCQHTIFFSSFFFLTTAEHRVTVSLTCSRARFELLASKWGSHTVLFKRSFGKFWKNLARCTMVNSCTCEHQAKLISPFIRINSYGVELIGIGILFLPVLVAVFYHCISLIILLNATKKRKTERDIILREYLFGRKILKFLSFFQIPKFIARRRIVDHTFSSAVR